MTSRTASCFCGQLQIEVDGEPLGVGVCHCFACQKRSGGSTVFHTEEGVDDCVSVAVGAFADPSFPPPQVSVYDSRRHPWVQLPRGIAVHAEDPS